MAVVVNELEMTPAPAKADTIAPRQGQQAAAPLTVTMLREIEKANHCKQRRIERLTAG